MILCSLPRASVKAECVHLNTEHNLTPASTNLCLGVKKTQGGGCWGADTLNPAGHTHSAELGLRGMEFGRVGMSTLGSG